MHSDPIADFLTRIRNVIIVGKKRTSVSYSKVLEKIALLMEENNFLEKTRIDRSGKFPVLQLTVSDKLQNLKRISTPGRRIYKKSMEIRPVCNGFGVSIISTSDGIMTGKQAVEKGIGGEIICEIF